MWRPATTSALRAAACGRFDEAVICYQEVLKIAPHFADAYSNLGVAFASRGQVDKAIAHFRISLELKPDVADTHDNLGIALARCGRFDEAIAHYQKALELKPDYADVRNHLDRTRSRLEELLKTLAGRRDSLRSRPDDVALLNDTARVLATNPNASIRNGAEAVELAQRAVRLSHGQEPTVLGTLAATYVETGRFPETVETAKRALTLATDQNNTALAETLQARIKLYQAGSPYRDAQQPSLPKSIRP